MHLETIPEAIARNSTPDARAQRRAEMRASTLATRRRNAADALEKIPGFACEVEILRDGDLYDVETYLPAIKRDVRRLADVDHPTTKAALDALGALWAVLP